MNSELNVATALRAAVDFVRHTTAMSPVTPDEDDYECSWRDGYLRIEFRSTDKSRLDQATRQSTRQILKSQGWSVRFADEDEEEIHDDETYIPVKLSIEFELERVFDELQKFIKARTI